MTDLHSPLEVTNRVLRAAQTRLDRLEGDLAGLLEPILEEAGARAASRFRHVATDHLTASAIIAAGPGVESNSTMVAVKPRPAEASAIASAEGLDPDTLHVTLAYLGEVDGSLQAVGDALRAVAALHAPLSGTVGGVGIFAPNEAGVAPAIALPDVPGLVELRVAVTEALATAGIDYSRLHGFAAHLTLDYFDVVAGGPGFDGPLPLLEPLHFDELLVVRGDVVEATIPLVGVPPLTAAAGQPPPWSAPAPDELVDADQLVRKLRTKTDPVRVALVEAAMTPTLRAAGLDFDVANPFTARVLEQSGAHVTNIAATTRANVMRIVRASYDEGLSIPDTARAIQVGMRSASASRALMIARTELAGAVNGGSLAAVQIAAAALGGEAIGPDGETVPSSFFKQWLTAPGAVHPRHEDYDGLDGQTVGLDEAFDVGGAALMFPADPDGDPAETINCRCALAYTEQAPEG